MPAPINLVGMIFGRLTAVERIRIRDVVGYLCLCSCGNFKKIKSGSLHSGKTKSCGCLSRDTVILRNTTHGKRKSPIYNVWSSMKARCLNKNDRSYGRYGGRGITVCLEWVNSFENFSKWAEDNGYQHGLSIDRIDNSLGYSPKNCRFSDALTQANNKRNNVKICINGESKTIPEWSREKGVSQNALYKRVKAGWPTEKLFIGGTQ